MVLNFLLTWINLLNSFLSRFRSCIDGRANVVLYYYFKLHDMQNKLYLEPYNVFHIVQFIIIFDKRTKIHLNDRKYQICPKILQTQTIQLIHIIFQIELHVLEIRLKNHKKYIWTHKFYNSPFIIYKWIIQFFAMYNSTLN
jgi:hypothetical protein